MLYPGMKEKKKLYLGQRMSGLYLVISIILAGRRSPFVHTLFIIISTFAPTAAVELKAGVKNNIAKTQNAGLRHKRLERQEHHTVWWLAVRPDTGGSVVELVRGRELVNQGALSASAAATAFFPFKFMVYLTIVIWIA